MLPSTLNLHTYCLLWRMDFLDNVILSLGVLIKVNVWPEEKWCIPVFLLECNLLFVLEKKMYFHFKTGRDPFFWSNSMDDFTFLEAGEFGQGKINYEVNAFFQIVWLFIIQRETIRIHNTLRTKRMPQRGCEGRINFQSSHSWR